MLPGLCIHCFFCQEHSFHLCLPSKQTPTHLSEFSSSITFSIKSFSLLDVCPSRITTLLFLVYPSQYIQHKVYILMYMSAPALSPRSLHWIVFRSGNVPESSQNPQYQCPSIEHLQKEGRKKVEREGGKEAKSESSINSTPKQSSHLTASEHLSCYHPHPNHSPLDFCNSLLLWSFCFQFCVVRSTLHTAAGIIFLKGISDHITFLRKSLQPLH